MAELYRIIQKFINIVKVSTRAEMLFSMRNFILKIRFIDKNQTKIFGIYSTLKITRTDLKLAID
ncbi:hypothetical protein CAPN005_07460 [Capnocytophaga cynodegmi]|nr:hypothetical protein CAPN005_07460 [Capnocytophaga cynodegmi]